MEQDVSLKSQDPVEPVPAARIDFDREDRQWIADRIQEVLETGQLTLGKYGLQFEEASPRSAAPVMPSP